MALDHKLTKVRRVDFYPTEWLDGCADLSCEERGAYITIVAMIYSRGTPLPDDPARLAKRCNMPTKRFNTVLARLIEEGKIIRDGGELMNNRAGIELERAINRTKIAQENAKSGGISSGSSRRKTRSDNDLDEAGAPLENEAFLHTPPTTNHHEEVSPGGDTENRSKPSPISTGLFGDDPRHDPPGNLPQRQDAKALFAEWWAVVPRKASKGQAEKAYRAALKIADPQTLLTGAIRWSADAAQTEPRYVKHPATWLNGQCWLDEPASQLSIRNQGIPDVSNPNRSPGRQSAHQNLADGTARAIAEARARKDRGRQ